MKVGVENAGSQWCRDNGPRVPGVGGGKWRMELGSLGSYTMRQRQRAGDVRPLGFQCCGSPSKSRLWHGNGSASVLDPFETWWLGARWHNVTFCG